ncbi:MAG: alpha-2,8-polysialyltransferase family protein [Gammaproteobacteria bacterium]|nr:alpha-2,8-polysialyltransferase family protein [Gammaproteobacteria bacterium]
MFFIASPLHLICARILATTVYRGETNRLFYLKPDIEKLINTSYWSSIDYLPWARHYPLAGLFGRFRRIIANANIVKARGRNAQQITLIMPVIDSEAYNYNISIAKNIMNGVTPEVHLLPDGLLNIRRHEQGKIREFAKVLRKFRRLFVPELNYHLFRGDRTGADDPIVTKIYTFPGFPNEYDKQKVIELDFRGAFKTHQHADINQHKALVIGQPLCALGVLSEKNLKTIADKIQEHIRDLGITEIDYKGHPRDKRNELCCNHYRPLTIEQPLENYIFENPYKVIIGINSTTLILSKLVLDDICEVVSCYPDLVLHRKANELDENTALFRSTGVKVIYSSDQGTRIEHN